MLDALSILQEAYECGILDATEVAIKINMTKENFVKERHPYSISSRKDGRFITTVRKEDEERQQIAAPTYKELISKLYDYYNDRKSDYEYVKHDISSGYRTVTLTKKAKKILDEVKNLSPDSEYLFTQANGERMTSRSFNYWLEKYCRDAVSHLRAVIASEEPSPAGCMQRACL